MKRAARRVVITGIGALSCVGKDVAQSSRAMRLALEDAGCPVDELGYINAHGSSTPLNDVFEGKAIRKILGAAQVPVSSTKGAHAHALGASGALELAVCAQIFEKNVLPPSLNVFEREPECDLDLIANQPRERRVNRVLSSSFGFGGINACVVLGRV